MSLNINLHWRPCRALLLTVCIAQLLKAQSIVSDTSKPSPRYQLAMVYDSEQEKTILFGGYLGGKHLDDMWQWDGTRWLSRGTYPQLARSGHTLAFDRDRNRVILFGGSDSTGKQRSTWEFDGTLWMKTVEDGPPAVHGPQIVYDAERKKTILFGGRGTIENRNNGDTWEYDGKRWKQISSTGPAGRTLHTIVYDEARGIIVLFGGNASEGQLDLEKIIAGIRGDTWEWDGERWKEIPIKGPPARDHHAMAYDAERKKVVIFGGFNRAYLGDTWEYDGRQWVQVDSTGPMVRGGKPGMAYDKARKRIILFGGGIGGGTSLQPQAMNDTWEWDGRRWVQR